MPHARVNIILNFFRDFFASRINVSRFFEVRVLRTILIVFPYTNPRFLSTCLQSPIPVFRGGGGAFAGIAIAPLCHACESLVCDVVVEFSFSIFPFYFPEFFMCSRALVAIGSTCDRRNFVLDFRNKYFT